MTWCTNVCQLPNLGVKGSFPRQSSEKSERVVLVAYYKHQGASHLGGHLCPPHITEVPTQLKVDLSCYQNELHPRLAPTPHLRRPHASS
jgi:hypothetical protein